MADLETVIEQLVLAESERASDELLGSTIGTIYDTPEQALLVKKLGEYVQLKDQEIERLCHAYYQDFVTSVDQMLRVRTEAGSLKQKIVSMNKSLQEVGAHLLQQEEAVLRLRQSQQNLLEGSAILGAMTSVLQHVGDANDLFSQRRYYAALKATARAEEECGPLARRFELAQMILERVPGMRYRVRTAVLTDMQSWFLAARTCARQVGRLAMADRDAHRNDADRLEREILGDQEVRDPLDDERVAIDFAPLYQALHIHSVLGRLTEFETFYMDNRRLQVELLVTASFNISRGQNDELLGFLAEVVGFFTIEERVEHVGQSWFSSAALAEELHDLAMVRIRPMLAAQFAECTTLAQLEAAKSAIVLFALTMQERRFSQAALTDILCSLCARYVELLCGSALEAIRKAIASDPLKPTRFESKALVAKVKASCPFLFGPDDEKADVMPYSPSVYETCLVVRDLMSSFYAFLVGFPAGQTELDDIFRTSLDSLLSAGVATAYTDALAKSTNVAQATQLLVNLSHMMDAATHFERLLASLRYSHAGFLVRLFATTTFRKEIYASKDVVCRLLNTQIDEYFARVDIERMQNEPEGTSSTSYMKELVAYLHATLLTQFTDVQSDLRNLFYISACEHLAEALLHQLVDPRVKRYDPYFFDNLHNQAMSLVALVSSLPMIDMSALFNEVIQMLALLRNTHIEEYLDEKTRRSKYNLIRRPFLLTVLERYRDGIFAIKKTEKERRKAIDNMIRVLSTGPKR